MQAAAGARTEERREQALLRQHAREVPRRVERRVRRTRRREHRGDGHDRVPGVAQGGPSRLGDRGLAVLDHLGHGQRPEHAERDEDVREGRDAERAVHRAGQVVAGSLRSPAVNVMTLKPR